MRYIITIILSVIFAQSFGQVQYIGGVNTTVINRGAFRSDSVVILPSRDTGTGYASQPYKGRMTVHSDSNLYYHNGSVWRDISSGTDTTSLSNRINVNKDSITYLGLNYYKNGGNSFGAPGIFGTKDANYIAFIANNIEGMRMHSATRNLTIGGTVDAGYKLDVIGTTRFYGNSTVTGTHTVDNISNFNYVKLVSNVTDPYISLFMSGAVDGRMTIKNTITGGGAGMLFNDGTNNIGLEASRIISSGGVISLYNSGGNSTLLLVGDGDNGVQFTEAGAAERAWMGYANGSSVFQHRVNGATSPSTGTLSYSIPSTGRLILDVVTAYADNAAAVTAGLAVGTLYYRTGHGLDIVR